MNDTTDESDSPSVEGPGELAPADAPETPTNSDGDGQKKPRSWTPIIVAALLAVFAGQAILSLRHKSVTTDEIAYIAAGYYHLETGRFDLNKTNPPLLKMIPALPLRLLDLELPPLPEDVGALDEVGQWKFARSFLYDNTEPPERILFWARLPIVLLGVALGLLIFRWARRLHGNQGGLLALTLFAFSPNLLAHTRFGTQDLGLALFFTATLYCLWRFFETPSLRSLVLCGLAFGAAVLTKTTSIFMLPVAFAYAVGHVATASGAGIWTRLPGVSRISLSRVRLRQTVSISQAFVIIGVILVLCLNVGYLFERPFEPLSDGDHPTLYQKLEKLGVDHAATRKLVDVAATLPLPVPGAFVDMVRFQATRVAQGNPVYFHGNVSRDGWWFLMFVALAIKLPIPVLVFLGTSLAVVLRRRPSSAEWLLLLGIGTLLTLFAILKSVNVGLRYVLPVLPLAYVLIGGLVGPRPRWLESTAAKIALGIGIAWIVIGTVRIHPHYLAHFNELVGGPSNGRFWLADSNLDWGQDLKALKKYMVDHDIPKVRLSYFGSADARYYEIDYDYLPSVGLAPTEPGQRWWYESSDPPTGTIELEGTIAISATQWAGVFYREYYAPLREREPDAEIGHSILIFRFDE